MAKKNKMVRIWVRLSDDELARLRALADAEGVTPGKMIGRLLERGGGEDAGAVEVGGDGGMDAESVAIRASVDAEMRETWRRVERRKANRGRSVPELAAAVDAERLARDGAGLALLDLASAARCLVDLVPVRTAGARAFVGAARAFADSSRDYGEERAAAGSAVWNEGERRLARKVKGGAK